MTYRRSEKWREEAERQSTAAQRANIESCQVNLDSHNRTHAQQRWVYRHKSKAMTTMRTTPGGTVKGPRPRSRVSPPPWYTMLLYQSAPRTVGNRTNAML